VGGGVARGRYQAARCIGEPAESYCAQKPGLVLPARSAAGFCHTLAYGLTLHIVDKPSKKITAAGKSAVEGHPSQGGLVLEHPAPSLLDGDLTRMAS